MAEVVLRTRRPFPATHFVPGRVPECLQRTQRLPHGDCAGSLEPQCTGWAAQRR